MKKHCQKLLSFILSVGVCISLAGPVCAETAQLPVPEAEVVADSIESDNAASSEGARSIESQSVSEPENVQNTDNNGQEISNTSETSSLQDESEIEATSMKENSARTYYVDAVNGQDENDGLTVETAWKNLDKINETVFQPGDQILLKRGCVWSGGLVLQGSGSLEAPIYLGSYGEGDKPRIVGSEENYKVVSLVN